jgi:hypothetical protein
MNIYFICYWYYLVNKIKEKRNLSFTTSQFLRKEWMISIEKHLVQISSFVPLGFESSGGGYNAVVVVDDSIVANDFLGAIGTGSSAIVSRVGSVAPDDFFGAIGTEG